MSVEKRAADDLLDKGGVRFSIGRRRYSIRKLKLGTILSISRQVHKMKSIDGNALMIQSVYDNAENLRNASRIVALAILNSYFKNWLHRPLAYFLLWRLDNEELYKLMKIVTDQMKVNEFFFTMTLTRGMSATQKIEKGTEAEKASTEPSQ